MNPKFFMVVIGLLLVVVIAVKMTKSGPEPIPETSSALDDRPKEPDPAAIAQPSRPRLPAPALPPLTNSTDTIQSPSQVTIRKMLTGEAFPELSADHIEKYLKENQRSAESLILAAGLTKDVNLLREAATNFPGDPRVHLTLAFDGEGPEEKSRALAAFRAADPDNSLGDYLAAYEDLKAGRTDAAVTNLMLATSKSRMEDYSRDQIQPIAEAHLSAGRSVAVAKVAGHNGMDLSHLSPLRDLGKQLVSLQDEYAQGGDAESAQAVGEIGRHLSGQLQTQGGITVVSELVGMLVEKNFLDTMDPATVIDANGLTATQRLADLEQRKQYLKELALAQTLALELSERDAVVYMDRTRLFGEVAAWEWLREKFGTP